MKKCKGCGAILQTSDPKGPGYTPKETADYCQRCFRLIHYDDLMFSMRTGIDQDMVLSEINRLDTLVLWVVDLFDFEAGMIPGLSRKLFGKDLILVCTKRDLLPKGINDGKLIRFIDERLKEMGIDVIEIVIPDRDDPQSTEEIRRAVEQYRNGRSVAVMGRANAGKSTLLNRLMQETVLTSSRYPGTTLELNELEIDGVPYIDTPGIEIGSSMLMSVAEKDLKYLLPTTAVKPEIYQIHGDQSFTIGGLARIDLLKCEKASCVFYCAPSLSIHRSKTEKADELWQKHYGSLFRPVPQKAEFKTVSARKEAEKCDIVIPGLGWACVSGEIGTMRVKAPKNTDVIFRKAIF